MKGELRGFAPIGFLEGWNTGVMEYLSSIVSDQTLPDGRQAVRCAGGSKNYHN